MPVVQRTSSSTFKRYSGDLITHQSSFSSITARADYRGKRPVTFRKFGVDMWRATGTIGAPPSLYVKIGSTERSIELPYVPAITPSRLGWTATDLLDLTDFHVSDTPVTLNFRSTSKSLVAVATNSSGVIDRAEYDYIQVPSAPGAKYTRSTTDASKVTVAITAPSDDGGSSVTGYTVEYSTSSSFSGSAKVSISGGGSKSTTITVANKGSRYYFRVMAKNAVTASAGSLGGAASSVWNDVMEILPGKPTITSVTPASTGKSATVAWSAAPTNGGSGAKSYTVKRYSSGGTLLSTNTTTSRSLTISGLTPGTTYKYTVTAVNNEGSGPASTTVSKTQPNVPSQVTGLSVTAHPLGRQANLSWDAPSGNGAAITSYEVQVTRSGSTTTTKKATSSSLTVTDLVPGSTYLFRVRALNSVGAGSYSAQSAAITMPNPSVSPGDYFDGSTAAADGVTFSWTGTAGKSTSVARVAAPEGWTTFAEAVGSSGGGVVTRSSADSASGSYSAAVTFWSGLTDRQAAFGLRHTAAIPPLATVTGSIFVKTERAQGLRPVLIFADASGNDVSRHYGDPVLVDEGRWTRLVITSPRPAKANEVRASIRVCMAEEADGGTPWYAGEVFYLDAAAITVSSAPYPYFDGSTPDDGQYEYAWMGAANASASTRTNVPAADTSIDPLLDPDCGPFPTPPRPPSIDVSCIAEVDQWRRYWIDIPAEEQADWTATLPTFIISTFGRSANQLRLRIYQDAFDNGVTEVTNGEYCSELILSYLPPNVELTLDSLNQRAYANVPGYADGLPADHLVFGTGGVPPTWPELECGIKYMVSLDVPSSIPVGAVQMKTLLTRRLR